VSLKIFSDHLKSGVYKIENGVNGKVYVGSAVNIKTRWYRHRRHLRLGTHHNPHLQNAWNKYGSDVFVMSVLENCPADNLIARETFHIDVAKSCDPDKGYNVMVPADGRLTHSVATRQKLRTARLKQGAIPHNPAKLFEHEGQSKSAKDWADHFGVN
jgi:group I intron endonuclease